MTATPDHALQRSPANFFSVAHNAPFLARWRRQHARQDVGRAASFQESLQREPDLDNVGRDEDIPRVFVYLHRTRTRWRS
jgi:hypothetical protein